MSLRLPGLADMHVHLRDGEMMKHVVPTVNQGGVSVAYVMPNLVPPITTVDACLKYKEEIERLDPKTKYLMSLYLSQEITPEVIYDASKRGVRGVKSYPKGATTNSDNGVESYEPFYATFAAMEETGMILNIHGEVPASTSDDVFHAEPKFLPTLLDLHKRFPNLKIVLEHCSTEAAIEAVLQCGPTVAGTITAHHMYITHKDWEKDPHCFCKPVAKTEKDRLALVKAATSRNPKFFFGSDSAPHPQSSKEKTPPAAGVFTQAFEASYLADIFDKEGCLNALQDFACKFGRDFYNVPIEESAPLLVLEKNPFTIPHLVDDCLVPFRPRETSNWQCRWENSTL
ncbi:dihydroorotase Ura2 [Schizosaccharomyces octosporus yFS286]|uniref:dihydroorotase n=1 Tax=Schizosaccharomyces octosporus (strain yFS286) TaxID=483514 RepID=S9PND4_SCHOY|nr:dihydroorotase Ura2 [Schizosaccharomyces octosporus yFS286]EPX70761.1 dihydroorotase Ura2 [Schizosaccharomyces octosporus yFS286]